MNMAENRNPFCPECAEFEVPPVDRRDFLRTVGGTVALGALAPAITGTVARAAEKAPAPKKRAAKPAEDLVRELYSTLTDEQKKQVVLPWNHGAGRGKIPTRLGMYNRAIENIQIGKVYVKPQQELVERILKSIASGEDGYRYLSRNGTFDRSRSLENCGAVIFGDPTGDKKFSWVFTGHHLTVRCDGNSEEGEAFGGPMYYGHSPHGYSNRNIFYYQTKSVLEVFDALSEKQRQKAVVKRGSPGEHAKSVQFRPRGAEMPGIGHDELTADQRKLIERVMRNILSPYRKEDADEVMDIIKKNGGMEKLHLAFYPDIRMDDDAPWHFWRIEGPGFVWNFRVLPHVHTYVHISSEI
jgi:hypothetical protein